MHSKAKTVDEYLAALPDDRREALTKLRALLRKHLDKRLVEHISYGMIGWSVPHSVYPPGTINESGPIASEAQGYHHNWIVQILPFIEQRNAYNHIDTTQSVYALQNLPVRQLSPVILLCPSYAGNNFCYTNYAAVHHDVEAPIDTDNHGVFFLKP